LRFANADTFRCVNGWPSSGPRQLTRWSGLLARKPGRPAIIVEWNSDEAPRLLRSYRGDPGALAPDFAEAEEVTRFG